MPSVRVEKERDILKRFTFSSTCSMCRIKKKKRYVAVLLTMQLKVCNPRLILSLWKKDVTKCAAAVTDASLLKDLNPTGMF